MKNLAPTICLVIAVLFLSATVSAADCSSNANQCTPKQLCSAATATEGGVKIWSKSSRYSKHVTKAKQVGINCGVVEIIASCDNDPELCNVDDLCKQSVQKSGGKTVWKSSSDAAGYIALAKEFGLKCGVTEHVVEKKNCAQDMTACSQKELCHKATFNRSGNFSWRWGMDHKFVVEAKERGLTCGVGSSNTTASSSSSVKKQGCYQDVKTCKQPELCLMATKAVLGSSKKTWNNSSYWKAHVTEAKRRGLSCGVPENVAKKKTCSDGPKYCNADQLCGRAVYYSGGVIVWRLAGEHVTEAKRRGLSCGVTKAVAQPKKICSEDTKACTDFRLCKIAAANYGTARPNAWNRQYWSKHVKEAKRRGLSCGVDSNTTTDLSSPTSKKKTCSEAVSVCNEADLCSKATHKHNGKRYWNSSNYKAAALNKRQLSKEYPYTTEAKQRGLTCDVNGNGKTTAKLSSCTSNGVTRTTTTAACPSNANKKTCNENAKDCNQTQLCSFAAHGVAQNRKWTSWSRHVTEAKRRGLTCGVTSPTTASNASSVKKKHCSQNAEVCNSTQLCRSATVISGGKKLGTKSTS
jgi:hypothetical protein